MIPIPIVDGIFAVGSKIIDAMFPDPTEKARAQLELLKLSQAGEFKEMDSMLAMAQGQMAINQVEAASASFFRGGWRPAVGWVCAAGLTYDFLARPLLPWFATVMGFTVPPLPPIDIATLMILLSGLLGLGGLRTFEKTKGMP